MGRLSNIREHIFENDKLDSPKMTKLNIYRRTESSERLFYWFYGDSDTWIQPRRAIVMLVRPDQTCAKFIY